MLPTLPAKFTTLFTFFTTFHFLQLVVLILANLFNSDRHPLADFQCGFRHNQTLRTWLMWRNQWFECYLFYQDYVLTWMHWPCLVSGWDPGPQWAAVQRWEQGPGRLRLPLLRPGLQNWGEYRVIHTNKLFIITSISKSNISSSSFENFLVKH